MSDALTDIDRDERRSKLYNQYLESLRAYLLEPTEENMNKVIEKASDTDDVPRGYFGNRTSMTNNLRTKIELLGSGDKEAWAKFLFGLDGNDFRVFKLLSPFAKKLLIAVDYGIGFVNFHGDVESLINQIIRNGKGWKTYDTDNYLVAFDQPEIDDAEVFWINCGILGINGPRNMRS